MLHFNSHYFDFTIFGSRQSSSPAISQIIVITCSLSVERPCPCVQCASCRCWRGTRTAELIKLNHDDLTTSSQIYSLLDGPTIRLCCSSVSPHMPMENKVSALIFVALFVRDVLIHVNVHPVVRRLCETTTREVAWFVLRIFPASELHTLLHPWNNCLH